MDNRKIKLINIGCKVNFAETSRLKDILSERGFEITEKSDEADIVLINTCTVTNKADSDCRSAIRKAKRAAPQAFVGVFGCYAQLNSAELEEMPEVNAVYGIKEKFMIPDMLSIHLNKTEKSIEVSDLTDLHFDFAYSSDSESRSRGFLKIQDGCNYRCTYCTIPNARGNPRSLEFSKLPEQFSEIRSKGYLELVLSGINLGEYSSEGKYEFEDVLKLISENDFGLRFRVSSIEPNLINDKIIEYICDSKNICPHFHIPLQSGSDKILKLMKRRYNSQKLYADILKIKDKNQNTCIGLDVICGFPGESELEFEETFKFIKSLPVSYLHVFTYSERKNTAAASFDGSVPKNIRKERTAILKKLSDEKLEEFYKSQIGSMSLFLPEKYDSQKKVHFGHSANYVNCFVATDAKLENKFYSIKLEKYSDGKVFAVLM